MTATELLSDPHSDLHAAIAAWERDGRAFLGFADWFYERDMIGQGRAWEWFGKSGVTPRAGGFCARAVGLCAWWYFSMLPTSYYAENILPHDLLPEDFGESGRWDFSSYSACIVAALDRWAEVFGESAVPLEEVAA